MNILAGDKPAAHAPIGPHSHQVGTLLKGHTQHSVAWIQRGRGETVKTLRVPTSPQGERSLAESRYDQMTPDDVCLMFTWALKIAPGFPIDVGK